MRHPEIFDQMSDEIAAAVLEQMEAAAECDALPGFIGDPRGAAIVEAWKRSRLDGEDLTDWSVNGTVMLSNGSARGD